MQYALRFYGIEESNLNTLCPFIGPPLKDSFMDFYQLDEARAEAAIEKYRERFKDRGMFENEVYPGIRRMLYRLKKNGAVLAVASSKPEVFVKKILEHFHLTGYFDVIVGSEIDGARSTKEEVVKEALCRLAAFGLNEGELEAAGADYIADTVEELEDFLMGTENSPARRNESA